MSKEFNYARAWREYVKPEFKKLYPAIKAAYDETFKVVDTLNQVGASHQLTGQSASLISLYEAIDPEILAWASQVVYFYGHLSPEKTAQEGGLYWKFQILADTVFFARKDVSSEVARRAKIKMDKALNNFDDHKEGTEYDNDELPDYIASITPDIGAGDVSILRVDDVNHKPDMFCITGKHMRLSQGMYLDPNVAPCGVCGQPYSAHTHERAMLLKVHTEKEERIKEAMKRILGFCEEHKIKIDGFALVK